MYVSRRYWIGDLKKTKDNKLFKTIFNNIGKHQLPDSLYCALLLLFNVYCHYNYWCVLSVTVCASVALFMCLSVCLCASVRSRLVNRIFFRSTFARNLFYHISQVRLAVLNVIIIVVSISSMCVHAFNMSYFLGNEVLDVISSAAVCVMSQKGGHQHLQFKYQHGNCWCCP